MFLYRSVIVHSIKRGNYGHQKKKDVLIPKCYCSIAYEEAIIGIRK
jgi:hypothetical protein